MNAVKLFASVALAGALTAATSGTASAQMTDNEKKLYEAAKAEGAVNWYVSQYGGEFAQAVANLFMARYPGVKVESVRTTGQVAFQRLTQEIRSNAVQADVLSTNDETHLLDLKKNNHLAQYTPENFAKQPAAVRAMTPEGYWAPTALGAVGIAYNTKLVKPEDAPKTWSDLLDPKWKNKVAIGHPGFSGSVGVWAIALRKLYGWEYFEKLSKNSPQIGRSIVDGFNLVVSGERPVALVPLNLAEDEMTKGAPVAAVYPSDGTLMVPGVSGVIKAGPHPNAARLMMEFLLSIEASKMLADNARIPLRAEVPPGRGGKAISDIKMLSVQTEEAVSSIEKVKEQFRDTFGI